MFIGTISFCHFIPLSVTLTLAGDHKVIVKQNLLAFQLIKMKFDKVLKHPILDLKLDFVKQGK